MSCLCLHRHKAAVHETYHIADGVHRGHFLLNLSTVIVEHLHLMRQVEVVVDRVLVAVELLRQLLIVRLTFGDVLDEVPDLLMPFVLPGVSTAPVRVEVALHLTHLLPRCLLGIFLHTGIDGGIDGQSVGIEVIAIVLAPLLQVAGHCLTEIGGLSVIHILDAEVEFDLCLLKRVELCLGQVAVLSHQVEHDVTALQGVLGIDQRIIIGGGLQHAHQYCRLFCRQVLRCTTEVGLAGRLDAERVRAEIHGVGILRQDLLLGKEHLQFEGCYPLLALHDEHLDAGDIAQQSCRVFASGTEEVLRQLLGDGGGSSCVAVQDILLGYGHKGGKVDAVMTVEAFVLRIDQCLPEHGVHLFVIHRGTVLTEELANHHIVGTVDLRGL